MSEMFAKARALSAKIVSIAVYPIVVIVSSCYCCGGCATDYSRIVPYAAYAPITIEEMSVYQYTEYPLFLAYQKIYEHLARHNPGGVYDKFLPVTHGLSLRSSNFNETLARTDNYPLACRKRHVEYIYANNDAERLSALANDLRGTPVGDFARVKLNELETHALYYTPSERDDEIIVRVSVSTDTRALLKVAMNLNGSNGSMRAYRAAIKRLDQLGFWGGGNVAERTNLLMSATKSFHKTSLADEYQRGGTASWRVYEEDSDFKRLLCAAASDIGQVVDVIADAEYTNIQKGWAEALPSKKDAVVDLWRKSRSNLLREVLVPKLTSEQIDGIVRFDPRAERRLEIMDAVTNQVVLTWVAQFDADDKVREKARSALDPKAKKAFDRNLKRAQAEQGTPEEMFRYAETMLGEGDKDGGIWWMKKAMNAGSTDAAFWLAQIELKAGNTNEWRKLVKKAADGGHARACFLYATDVLEKDDQLAYGYSVRAFYGGERSAGGVIANLLEKKGVKLSEQQIDILYFGVGGSSKEGSLGDFFKNYRDQLSFKEGQKYVCDDYLEVRQVLSKWQGVLVGCDLRYATGYASGIYLPDRVIFVKTDCDYDEHAAFKEEVVYLGKFAYKTVFGAEKEVRMFESVARRKRLAEEIFSMGSKVLRKHSADLK